MDIGTTRTEDAGPVALGVGLLSAAGGGFLTVAAVAGVRSLLVLLAAAVLCLVAGYVGSDLRRRRSRSG